MNDAPDTPPTPRAPTFANVLTACARAAHEAERAILEVLSPTRQRAWDELSPEGQAFAIERAAGTLAGQSAQERHDRWYAARLYEGWRLGARNDAAKTHPLLVPYRDLPESTRALDDARDVVVRAVAITLGAQL